MPLHDSGMRCHDGIIIIYGTGEMPLADSRGMGKQGGISVTGLYGVEEIPLRSSEDKVML
jgi:hypothetical protein